MRFNSRIWFSAFALCAALSSCEDHRIPQAQRVRIKKVFKKYANTDIIPSETIYSYTSDGRLASMESHSVDGSPTVEPTLTFLYKNDSKGRLQQATTNYGGSKYIFYFDTTGRLSTKYTYSSSPVYESLTQEDHLEYGNTPFPLKITTISGRLGMARLYSYQEYTYSEGNLVQMKSRTRNEGETFDRSNDEQTFQYDDKPNPYYGFIFGYYRDPDLITFSKNNLLNNYEVNTYDTNGLLTKITHRDGAYEFSYEYETY